jgi:hypothetical protein
VPVMLSAAGSSCRGSPSLALALLQALLAQRPITQLNRWRAEDVLVAVSMQQRRRPGPSRAVLPVVVRSVLVQHPSAEWPSCRTTSLSGRETPRWPSAGGAGRPVGLYGPGA